MTQTDIIDYFNNPGLNQSKLSDLEKDPRLIDPSRVRRDEDTTYLRKGSAMDVLITGDIERFQKEFYVMTTPAPTGQMLLFVEACFNRATESGYTKVNDITESIFRIAYEEVGFKRDTFSKITYDRFPKEGLRYLQALLSSKDKTVLTQVEAEVATACAASLLEHDFTREWIAEQPDNTRYKYYYQVPIYWMYRGVECKALIDIIRLDTRVLKVTPIDIKSIGSTTLMFPFSVMKYKYFRQASWYTMAVNHWIKMNDLTEFSIENLKFIVESTTSIGRPIIYNTTDKLINVGKNGGVDYNGKTHKGYDQLIDEYKFHKEKGQWHYPKEAWDTAGEISLDLFK